MYNYITPEQIYNNEEITTYIKNADSVLTFMSYNEHGLAHAKFCSLRAEKILRSLEYDNRSCELAAIAGYLHDIGNLVNRVDHSHHGALIAFNLLKGLNMPPEEVAIICSAIGHHDEKSAYAVSAISSAVIIADKTDVRRSRVRKNVDFNDIHDRVSYAVEKESVTVLKSEKTCVYDISIDIHISPVIEFFELFTNRMLLCKKACDFLGLDFQFIVNGTELL